MLLLMSFFFYFQSALEKLHSFLLKDISPFHFFPAAGDKITETHQQTIKYRKKEQKAKKTHTGSIIHGCKGNNSLSTLS